MHFRAVEDLSDHVALLKCLFSSCNIVTFIAIRYCMHEVQCTASVRTILKLGEKGTLPVIATSMILKGA